jgi:hypothetical protein
MKVDVYGINLDGNDIREMASFSMPRLSVI